jgi:hypothetical protein
LQPGPTDGRITSGYPISRPGCGKRGADVRPDFHWNKPAGRGDGLPVTSALIVARDASGVEASNSLAVGKISARSLALPCFLAFIHRLQAKRRASISGGELGSALLAIAYANINVATSRHRGARGDKGQPADEHRGQDRK